MKHLPIDDNMNGIIEEDEMEEEGSDLEDENDENEEWTVKKRYYNENSILPGIGCAYKNTDSSLILAARSLTIGPLCTYKGRHGLASL